MGKIIAITTPKGKAGKTTTAINLAIAFALSGKKTLLIDLDPAGSCSSGLGFSNDEVTNKLFDDLKSKISLRRFILKTVIENLYFIQIGRVPYLDAQRLGETITNELILKIILEPEESKYEYIILDCPPHITGTINAGLIAADSVLIPVVPGKLSIASVRRMIAHLSAIREQYNPELKIEGILLTMYEYNNNLSFTFKKELFRNYPKYTLNTSIPKSSTVKEAATKNKPLLIYYPNDKAAKAYLRLAEELLERKFLFDSVGNI
jgi:chromosome partitioning protein